jgi:hypothetical protein
MGAQLAKQAYAFGASHPLTASEMRFLVWMALTAKDTDERPIYFMSREQSALALGRIVPDEPRPGQEDAAAVLKERKAAFQAVKVATTGLVSHGAIRSLVRGRTGHRAEYELTLGQLAAPSASDTQG